MMYGLQLANGIELGASPGTLGHISSLGGLSIGFFIFAIARAWALVGARRSDLLMTVAGIARRPADPDTPAAQGDQAGQAGSSPSHEDSG